MSAGQFGRGTRLAPHQTPPITCVIDCETDPFRPSRHVAPFAWGFWDGAEYKEFLGVDCTEGLLCYLRTRKDRLQIFAHNGGRFDFMFFIDRLRGEPLIINGRIVNASLYHHTVSDSYARLPVPLSRFGSKKEIDYSKLEAGTRHKHMPEICAYLKQDCLALYEVVTAWQDKFGSKPSTMATAAYNAAAKTVRAQGAKINHMGMQEDARYRKFYFGGRVQAFRLGIVKQQAKMYDANSMYPYIMGNVLHPVGCGSSWREQKDLCETTDFARIRAWSKGALPMRDKEGRLSFPSGYGTFFASGHEIRAGLRMERLKIDAVEYALECGERINFREFIEPVYRERLLARAAGDVMQTEFLKLLMNSGYGKLAINPRKFKSHLFIGAKEMADEEILMTDKGMEIKRGDEWWQLEGMPENEGAGKGLYRFVRKADETRGYKNVAAAASITAAARAYLFEMLCLSERPIYCDTDSIVCEKLAVESDPSKLGAWKFEAEGDEMAVAGKKMYALFGDEVWGVQRKKRVEAWGDPKCVKLASKGVRLHAHEMREIAKGNVITMLGTAPSFDNMGKQGFVNRTVRITNPDLVSLFPGVITRGDIMGGLERVN